MAELITIAQLSALIEDQYLLLGFLEDAQPRLPAYDPIALERNEIEVAIRGERWSITATRADWEWCHRDAGRTVVLRSDHPSPFDFMPKGLLRYVHSTDETSQLNEVVLDNWLFRLVRAGRLAPSRHRDGYFTFG